MDMQILDKGTHGSEITFSSPNVDNLQQPQQKGSVLEHLINVDPEAAWIDQGLCLDIADSNVDVGIKVRVHGELNSM